MTSLAIAAVALGAAACGAGSALEPSPSPAPTQASSPSQFPSPAPKVLSFSLNPEPTVVAKGTIAVSAGPKSTSVELKITGLQANSSHVSHIHIGSCQVRGGIAFALNQVVADGQGMSDTKTTLNITYPPASGKWYVVVHAGPDMQGNSASYLMCGNLF